MSSGRAFPSTISAPGIRRSPYLKLLPLSQVKIDRSFVRDVIKDQSDAAIVRAILAMSQTLELQVGAGGVESQEQRDFLFQNGCLAFQGYLWRSRADRGVVRVSTRLSAQKSIPQPGLGGRGERFVNNNRWHSHEPPPSLCELAGCLES